MFAIAKAVYYLFENSCTVQYTICATRDPTQPPTYHLDRSSKKGMTTLPHPPSFDEHLAAASLEALPPIMSSLPTPPTMSHSRLAHDGKPVLLYTVLAALTWVRGGNKRSRRTSKSRAMRISGVSGTGGTLGFYTQGVGAKADGRLREALLLNRAVCNLGLRYLETYGSVSRDCAAVIVANTCAPSKAYYCAGLALLALNRPDEALNACAHAGDAVADDVGLKTLRAQAEEKRAETAREVEE
ncbi:hypothetical protein BJV78DRAFT_1151616 [Lactifluus subvellereus]|nr:hypothetical protein BJV78DRAFT_1151616 [Lactifluus subvellereus]